MTSSSGRRRLARVWGETWRILLCLSIGFVLFGVIWSPVLEGVPKPARIQSDLMLLDAVGGLLATPLVLLRRRHPRAVAAALTLLGGVSTVVMPAQLLAAIALAGRRRLREVLALGVLWMAAVAANTVAVAPQIMPVSQSDAVTSVAIGLVTFVAVTAIGWSLGARRALHESWRDAAEWARREQVARVAQARTAERARIAREMHDVVAHQISLVSLHAGVLAYQDDLTDDERRETAALIQTTAHRALEELRAVLGVLREDGQDAVAPPQPSLLDLPTLLAQEEAAGAQVRLDVPEGFWGVAAGLAPTTSRHAHRIVQECLTNARKHAPGQPVTVTIAGAPGRGLDLEVSNPLGRSGSGIPGAGLGLAGLGERAELAGGTLTAGERDGTFGVRAHLPWEAV